MPPRDSFAAPPPRAPFVAGLLAAVAVVSRETAGSPRFHCVGPHREHRGESLDLASVRP
jgi:hypothetical protein